MGLVVLYVIPALCFFVAFLPVLLEMPKSERNWTHYVKLLALSVFWPLTLCLAIYVAFKVR